MRLTILMLFLAASTASALPRFAMMTGMECLNCHVNPTGGELRNTAEAPYFEEDHLQLIPDHGKNKVDFNPQLTRDILIGGDIRFQYLYDGHTKESTFQSMDGAIYSAIHLHKSMRFYVKYDFINTAYEAYGLYDFNAGDSWVKVGAFAPSYGIRLDDHTAYTRGGNFGYLQGIPQLGLIFGPDYRSVGAEVGSKLGGFLVTADVTNGDGYSNLNFTSKKALIGRVEYMTSGIVNLMLGGSGYFSSGIKMYGVQGGIGIDSRLVFLGEYDWARNLPNGLLPPNVTSNAGMVQATYEIRNGLVAMGRFDYFKTYAGGPYYSRYILGVNIYPILHLDLMPQIRLNTTDATGGSHPFEALIQSHVYF